jgi:hypothetical protein
MTTKQRGRIRMALSPVRLNTDKGHLSRVFLACRPPACLVTGEKMVSSGGYLAYFQVSTGKRGKTALRHSGGPLPTISTASDPQRRTPHSNPSVIVVGAVLEDEHAGHQGGRRQPRAKIVQDMSQSREHRSLSPQPRTISLASFRERRQSGLARRFIPMRRAVLKCSGGILEKA